jgi:hypothetical protein
MENFSNFYENFFKIVRKRIQLWHERASNSGMRTRIQILACARAFKFWHTEAHTNLGHFSKFYGKFLKIVRKRIQILECARTHKFW